MVKNGLDKIIVSVSDIDRSIRFFRETIGLLLVTREKLDVTHYIDAWGLDIDRTADIAILRHPQQETFVELIQFHPTADICIRDHAEILDFGIYDIAFRTRDVEGSFRELSAKGYVFYSEPVVYTADWTNVTVKEAILIGPDRVPFALIERLTEPVPDINGKFGPIIDSAQIAEDMDEVSDYYQEVMGLTKIFDQDLPDGLIDDVLKLPAKTHSRMAFFIQPGKDRPFFEFVTFSRKGKALSDWVKPPNIGILAQGCEVEDLSGIVKKSTEKGYRVVQPVSRVRHPLKGDTETCYIRGPHGVLLEFFQIA